jgi:hypothetical protein
MEPRNWTGSALGTARPAEIVVLSSLNIHLLNDSPILPHLLNDSLILQTTSSEVFGLSVLGGEEEEEGKERLHLDMFRIRSVVGKVGIRNNR